MIGENTETTRSRNSRAPGRGSVRRGRQRRELTFPYAMRSYLGYLEGTEKAKHTISSYRSDLKSFQVFLEANAKSSTFALKNIELSLLERYHDYLKTQGQKVNSRRRKLLTVRRLLEYLNKRNKLAVDAGKKLPTPYKVERIPDVADYKKLLGSIRALDSKAPLESRNRLLLWFMAETGLLVSEIPLIRFDCFVRSKGGKRPPLVQIPGKGARTIEISRELYNAVEKFKKDSKAAGKLTSDTVFLGHNKHGSLGGAISSRGVELLVRSYASRLAVKKLVPRMIRHSAVVGWYEKGMTQDEIQARLGLKSDYTFRIYAPLFKKIDKRKKKP